ncbi:MAG: phosphoribosylglycinamide formyltransferase [Nitrospirae bacterium]|nr:phosphoribosylglycinamide formyltransferase [Nitrospirota bacterium]
MKQPKLRLGVLASGRGSNLQAIIDASEQGKLDAEVVVVISDISDAFALERAGKHGIPGIHISPKDFKNKKEYEEAIVEKLREHNTGLVLLAGYMRLVTNVLIAAFDGNIMNIHPALLPSFKGLHAQQQALEYGVRYSGCSVHFVTIDVDGGPVILQAVVPVFDNDTEETLSARILEKEHMIYPEAVQLFAEGRLKRSGKRVCIIQ